MKIITWKVNSVKARLPIVLDYLRETKPDVVLLQELKTREETFPFMEFEDLGYNIAVSGQKSYNGVGIFSKYPLEDVIKEMPGNESDEQARYIEAVTNGVRVASIYIPNGREVDSEHFHYKLDFLKKLKAHTEKLLTFEEAFVLGGDYNITPEDADVYHAERKKGGIHCSLPERLVLRELMNLGLTEAAREIHPIHTKGGQHFYSWWDYRAGSWQRNEGMRIDLLLLSPQAADRLQDAGIDPNPRALPKASDHTPVWCFLNS